MAETSNQSDSDILIVPNENREEEDDQPQGCCDPRAPGQRFLGLILMCVLGFGMFFFSFLFFVYVIV